jgi:hypothetical protein
LAKALAERLDACVIEGDDFYAGGIGLRADSPALRAAACIDWRRQRLVLEALAAGWEACWRAFDWDAFDGRLCNEPTKVKPRLIAILEGVYAARRNWLICSICASPSPHRMKCALHASPLGTARLAPGNGSGTKQRNSTFGR